MANKTWGNCPPCKQHPSPKWLPGPSPSPPPHLGLGNGFDNLGPQGLAGSLLFLQVTLSREAQLHP